MFISEKYRKKTYTQTTVGSATAKTATELTIVDKGSKKIFVYPDKVTETDLDGNTVTTLYEYDHTNGYPIFRKDH